MLLAYLKSRALGAAVLALFTTVFALVFYLCGLPLNAVAYAGLICCTLGAALLAVDFARFCQRARLLAQLLSCPENAADALPEPRGEVERDYQALMRAVRAGQLAGDAQRREKAAAMSDYYTLWAHQIKTPIAAMDLMLQSPDSLDAQALAAELLKIEQYVDMALGFMRLEGEGSDFVIARYALEPIVKGAVRKYARLFILKNIHLELGPLTGTALTDAKWLGFALGQVIANAVKYTPAGGRVRIFVQAGPVLVVEDSGIGIRAEDLPRVFERGYTGLTGRTDANSTGIGLYLTRRILTALGHKITLTSRAGQGAQVHMDLRERALQVE